MFLLSNGSIFRHPPLKRKKILLLSCIYDTGEPPKKTFIRREQASISRIVNDDDDDISKCRIPRRLSNRFLETAIAAFTPANPQFPSFASARLSSRGGRILSRSPVSRNWLASRRNETADKLVPNSRRASLRAALNYSRNSLTLRVASRLG